MTPCYDFQPRGVNCLPEDVKMNQKDYLESELEGHFLVKGDWKVADLLSPVMQAAQVPVGTSFCS